MEPIVYVVVGALACLGLIHLIQQVSNPRRYRGHSDEAMAALVQMILNRDDAPRRQPVRQGRHVRRGRGRM